MRKNKKLLLLLLCGAMSVAAIGLGSCEKDSDIVSTTPPVVEELDEPSLSLNMKNVTLPLFGKATLVATLKNSTEPLVWNSSDASVASVSDGEIYGGKEGSATITVTAGSLSATCQVTVTADGVTAEFAMLADGMTLYLGAPYKLDPTVVSAGEPISGAEVTFKTEGDVFTLDEEGNVTALKEGEQTLTATATVNGVTIVSATYTVKIREYLSVQTGIDQNTLQLKLTDYLDGSLTEYSLEGFKAIVGTTVREDVTFEYEVEDETVAKLENGKILPLKAGETTVSVSFNSPVTQKPYVGEIKVIVGKETVVKSVDFLAKSATGTKKADFEDDITGVTPIDLTGTGIDLTRLTSVREGHKTLVSSASGSVLNVTDASCGEIRLDVELDNVIYTIDGFIAQTLISNKTDLQTFYTKYGTTYGYTVLTNDIDMGGETLDGGAQWFRCIFDGRGHTISNFVAPHGIVAYQSEGSLIKNVQFVNVVKDSGDETTFSGEPIGAVGLFGHMHTGMMRDVLVVGTIKNPAETQAVFLGHEYSQAAYTNVVVVFDVENAENTNLIGTGAFYNNTSAKNVFSNMRYVYDGEMTTSASYAEGKDIAHYRSVSEFVATNDFSGFGGYWQVEQNALPVMGDLTKAFEKSVIVLDGSIEIGQTIEVSTMMACATVSLKNPVNGVTFDGKTLTIGANAALGSEIVLVFTNAVNDVKLEKTFKLRAAETLTYSGKYVDAMNGQGKLDLSKLSKEIDEVKSVSINGLENACETKDGILYYNTTAAGKLTIVLNTDGYAYAVEVLQADNVISSWAEYSAWAVVAGGGYNSYNYTVLANDITAPESVQWTNGGHFQKTFDGLGHTIDGFNCGHGIVQRLLDGAVWKNVVYTNVTVNDTGLFGYLAGGTFENLTISGTLKHERILAYGVNSNNTKIVNCTFNLTSLDKADKYLTLGETHFYTITFENSTINYTGKVNYETCPCGCGNAAKITLTNSTINSIVVPDAVDTNYYAKVSGGTATFALSQMGEDAPTTVSKLTVNGVETQATVADGVLSYPATSLGSTTLVLATDEDVIAINIVHADNVITTWDEYNAWALVAGGGYNSYEYTVLASDITAPAGAKYTNGGYFEKTFDGLGHTIDGFNCGHGIVQRLLTGATWKNVNYTNLTAADQGLFGYLGGGTFESVTISGTLTDNRILGWGLNNSNTKFVNCTFTLTKADNSEVYLSNGEHHYYIVTFENSTVNYTGTVNTATCSCCGKETKYTLTNSTINSNYVAQ